MKLGLSAIGFLPGTSGGIETYFRDLLEWLQRVDTVDSFHILCDRKNADWFELENPSFRLQSYNFAKPSFNWLVRGVLRKVLHKDILASRLDKLDLDVIHHPFSVLSPAGLKTPTVLTFWDMQHEFYPEFFSTAELQRRKAIYKPSAVSATRVIVSSEFTRNSLVEKYGILAEKIDVVYTGFGSDYRPIDDLDALAAIKKKYGLDAPFLYYPAAFWAHKNHGNLLKAIKLLRDEFQFDGQLVLTGVATGSSSALLDEIGRLGLADCVKILGYLPYAELPYLFNLATMLVFPSLFEGFGIPLVEAMACGCPVACSRAASLPEVIGDAGVLFDPSSPKDMAEKIGALWSDSERLQEMRLSGLERAKLFNWENTARQTLEVYRKAAASIRL
jgi:glycosyltransferase involved in cell wall biosynthesis